MIVSLDTDEAGFSINKFTLISEWAEMEAGLGARLQSQTFGRRRTTPSNKMGLLFCSITFD